MTCSMGQDEGFPAEGFPGSGSAVAPVTLDPRPTPDQPPRMVDGGCLTAFSLIWPIISLIFLFCPLVMFWMELSAYRLLRTSGVVAEAVVMDRRVDEDADGRTYYVTYRFTAPLAKGDQGRFTREQSVNRKSFEALPLETRVSVVYAPSDPSISRPQSKLRPPFFLLAIACLGAVFVVVGLAVLSSGWTTMWQARGLRRHGQLTQGTVLDRWTETDSDGERSYCVAYEYHPSEHPQITKAEYNRDAYETLAPGDLVLVRYLPGSPSVARLDA